MTIRRASQRLQRRIIRHHFPLLIASAALIAALYVVIRSDYAPFRWSMATAYAGLLLLGATLLIGPINILRKRSTSIGSIDLRRDIGIWAGVVSLLHVIVGLQVHSPGNMLGYFWPLTMNRIFSNYTGLVATLVIALLLALSNDWSLRRLRTEKWKSLQRWNYAGFALTVLHGVVYQVLEKREPPYPIVFGFMVLLVIAIQFAGYRQRRRMRAA